MLLRNLKVHHAKPSLDPILSLINLIYTFTLCSLISACLFHVVSSLTIFQAKFCMCLFHSSIHHSISPPLNVKGKTYRKQERTSVYNFIEFPYVFLAVLYIST